MMFGSQNLDSDQNTSESNRHFLRRISLRLTAIFGLITASVIFVMVCPCDSPWQKPIALVLLSFSLATCLAAAWVLFGLREFARNSTPILRAVISVGLVIAVRFVELKLAINCVAWLAEHSR